jgi:hypothetical protein
MGMVLVAGDRELAHQVVATLDALPYQATPAPPIFLPDARHGLLLRDEPRPRCPYWSEPA